MHPLVGPVVEWYVRAARDLPWRHQDCTAWGVMVSEFMLQQTPVARVLGPWQRWLERWPTPADLAAEPVGEAIREWDRLGYPRRAQRLHAAATAITADHGGQVPTDHDQLLALPGVGEYTAAAIASFAFGDTQVVLDTNVRRVLARALSGVEFPPPTTTAAERQLGAEVMPVDEPISAALWAAASMELGALICTARSPACADCPIRSQCAWLAAGRPAHSGPPRRGQSYAGTDRQVRGLILGLLREQTSAVPRDRIDQVWPDAEQRERALAALVADGLAVPSGEGYTLPG